MNLPAQLLIGTVLLGLLTGCQQREPAFDETFIEGMAQHNARNALDWNGVYTGIEACADCEGIETHLEILPTGHFVLTRTYLGKSDSATTVKGEFTWNTPGNSIALYDGNRVIKRYFVGENTLFMLDQKGQRIQSQAPQHYRLLKQYKNP